MQLNERILKDVADGIVLVLYIQPTGGDLSSDKYQSPAIVILQLCCEVDGQCLGVGHCTAVLVECWHQEFAGLNLT